MDIVKEVKEYLLSVQTEDGLFELVEEINRIRSAIHEVSPFKDEPVDFVEWVRNDTVKANDYNPNSVAPP